MTSTSKFKGSDSLNGKIAWFLSCILLLICMRVGSDAAEAAEGACGGLSQQKLDDIRTYIAKLNHLVSTDDVKLVYSRLANRACFWKLSYATQSGRSLGDFFLSPDQQFATPTLLDLSVDPREEEQKRRLLTAQILSAGAHPARGPRHAPVVIVEFADFECPFCKRQADILRNEILTHDEDSVRLEYRHFPLAIHSWAMEAANASACVYSQSPDNFWLVHDYFYGTQEMQKKGQIEQNVEALLASSSTFSANTFKKCMEENKVIDSVRSDQAIGHQLAVQATPTIFINGVMFKGLVGAAQIRGEIQKLMSDRTSYGADGNPLAPAEIYEGAAIKNSTESRGGYRVGIDH